MYVDFQISWNAIYTESFMHQYKKNILPENQASISIIQYKYMISI